MKIKLDDVIDALEIVNDGINCYYIPETAEIFVSNIKNWGKSNGDELDELFENSIMLPTKNDINEYEMMVEFADTIEDSKLQNQLYISLNGSGAFKRFKDTCINYDIIDDWYNFRDKKYKDIAINWCQENNIKYN